jgi:hypothetical protein
MKRTCEAVIGLVSGAEERLTERDRALVAQHSQECEACRPQVAALRALARSLQAARPELSPLLAVRTKAAIRRRLAASEEASRTRAIAAAAATSTLLLTAGYGVATWWLLATVGRLAGFSTGTLWVAFATLFALVTLGTTVAALATRVASFQRPLRTW